MSGNGLAQCELCQNGSGTHTETVDGDDVDLCGTCQTMLRKSGRIEGPKPGVGP